MIEDMTEDKPATPKRLGSGAKMAALSAALRANLARRKARQRALCQPEQADDAEPAPSSTQEDGAKWTK